jgi:hypothetical protein
MEEEGRSGAKQQRVADFVAHPFLPVFAQFTHDFPQYVEVCGEVLCKCFHAHV